MGPDAFFPTAIVIFCKSNIRELKIKIVVQKKSKNNKDQLNEVKNEAMASGDVQLNIYWLGALFKHVYMGDYALFSIELNSYLSKSSC